jgi:hypothetical protein
MILLGVPPMEVTLRFRFKALAAAMGVSRCIRRTNSSTHRAEII